MTTDQQVEQLYASAQVARRREQIAWRIVVVASSLWSMGFALWLALGRAA